MKHADMLSPQLVGPGTGGFEKRLLRAGKAPSNSRQLADAIMISDDRSHLVGIDVERWLKVADAIEGLGDGSDGHLVRRYIIKITHRPPSLFRGSCRQTLVGIKIQAGAF